MVVYTGRPVEARRVCLERGRREGQNEDSRGKGSKREVRRQGRETAERGHGAVRGHGRGEGLSLTGE